MPAARDEFGATAATGGWTVTRIRDEPQFCRLQVHGPEDLLVDLLVDAPPNQPSAASVLGPTLGREDLAGRKLPALFDRAAPRDFVDVYMCWPAATDATCCSIAQLRSISVSAVLNWPE